MAPPKRPIKDRFWEKVELTPSCWIWTGGKSAKGYGVLWVDNTFKRSPRVSWELAVGAIPTGVLVLHRCDNPPCVRPDHLYLGTAKDNAWDRERRGRSRRRAHRKLTWEQAQEIIELRRGGMALKSIGNLFDVSIATIHNIVTGKTYRNR